MSKFSERLRDCVDRKGITQRALAEQCGLTEVSVSRYIAGTRMPKGKTIAALAEILGTTPNYLLGVKEEDNPVMAYNAVTALVAQHGKNWTQKQKFGIMIMLFGTEDDNGTVL